MNNLIEIKKEMLVALKILIKEGIFDATMGHISARVPGTDMLLMSGHIHPVGRTLDSISEDDISLVNLEGEKLEGRLNPPGEKFIHTEVYKARPDVGAVVHAHPPYSIIMTIAGQDILPVFHRGTIFSPKVPTIDYPGQIDTPELGQKVAAALGSGYACMLQGHGSVCAAENVRQACVVSLALEKTSLFQMQALQMGGQIKTVSPEFIENGFIKGLSKEEYFSNPWAYFSNKVLSGD